jgi:opacity protein-like surface antigen
MIARLTLAAAALLAVTAAPALAADQANRVKPEVRIRNMVDYLEAVADPGRGIYIRGYTGQWYYATVRGQCPRLTRSARLSFNTSPGGDFDKDSTIRADGWRCMVDSVTESDAPPRGL